MEHQHQHQQYTCPMHPEVVQPAPGKCPICGMDLVPVTGPVKKEPQSAHQHQQAAQHHDHAGHQHPPATSSHQRHDANPPMGHAGHDHHAMMIDDFKKRFYIVLLLTIPIMLLSQMIQHWLGIRLRFTGDAYLLLALSSFVFFYGGWPFLKGWYQEMRHWNPGMMTLIGFAITVAYIYSVATVVGLQGMDFFWELATLILIMLLGHWIEMKSVAGASRELELLIQLMPDEAHLVQNNQVTEVKTASLREKDTVLIKPGEKVPADGIITQGDTYLNESMLTGESKPVEKKKGDKVIAGSINGNGAIQITVSHAAQYSYLSQVIQLVQDAQRSRSNTQLLADKAARWLTLIAILAGIATFLAWYLAGKDLAFSIERMVTVIVICCPHALGLAVPLVVAKSTALSAQHGLLIKNRTAFENARKITTLVFDKTGTLTVGKFEVSTIQSLLPNLSEKELLKYAAALEQNSEHPIATGILQKAKEQAITILPVQNFTALTGKGIEATVDGHDIKVVSPGYLDEKDTPACRLYRQCR
ncbi:heavy metal translocating P-type ATPase [Paraflavitalea speifideaquila]|uniref:heavy metal translocating P-type ATPase n=1 Tax=Paraflavitalea speifideaquila TaxID=3076558 RepID=UPI0028EE0BA9|nr:heavy metal translocating P-type ATPase [Paraflavitalea speifideiaquila]